jgi:outer membrane protein assembly factor BamB
LWSYETGARCGASPLVVDDLVVVGDDDGVLHAVGAADGRRRWIVERGFMLSTSQLAGGYILTGGYDERLQAIRPADGAAVWTWPSSDPVVSPATVIGDTVAIGGCDGKVHVISLADGKTIAQMEATAQVGAAMPWDGLAIYAVTIEGNVSRFSSPDKDGAENGEAGAWSVDWQRQYDVDASSEITHHAPQTAALAGNRLVATFADGWLRCLRSNDGHAYWQRRPGGFIGGSAVIADGRVVVGDTDGALLVLSLVDGKTLWRDVVGGRLTASPAVAEGCVVIGSSSGSIVCYGE